mgnify:CR=1 FL=1
MSRQKVEGPQLLVITGLSGSGKSSLAFDTIYAEGQRRYVETFSPYARQFMERLARPAAEKIGYPVVVRPSFVLGGRAMQIVQDVEGLRQYMRFAVRASAEHPVLIDRFLADATEVDVELVLAVDVSRSMDFEELKLQRDGYVAAFRDPEVIRAQSATTRVSGEGAR